jgi:hypothetical protein
MNEQWFDAAKRPARPGVYQVLVPSLDRRTWARWTGEHWTCWSPSPQGAAMCQWAGIRDGYYWRVCE